MSTATDRTEARRKEIPGIVHVPGWERFPWLRAGFSTRLGGRSTVYGPEEQNLGWTAGDDPAVVAENRRAFVRAVAESADMELVTLHQIHSAVVRAVETETAEWMTPDGKARLQGDGLVSNEAGRLLGVITADCVPVFVADTRTRAVAAFHAGWRGTLAGIVQRGVGEMRLRYGAEPGDLVAAIGPSIRACCFAVGEEVRSQFAEASPYAPLLFSEAPDAGTVQGAAVAGRLLFMDLQEANRRQLLEAGVSAENISVVAECTACSRLADGRRRYYSHRAEHGVAGRMLSVIGVARGEV